jgi:hypothetical protein
MLDHKFPHLTLNEGSESGTEPPTRVPTPVRQAPKRLRPYVYALMAFKHGQKFQTKPSVHRSRRLSELIEKEGPFAPTLTVSSYTVKYAPQLRNLTMADPLRWHICRFQRRPYSGCSNRDPRHHIPPRFLSPESRAERRARERW